MNLIDIRQKVTADVKKLKTAALSQVLSCYERHLLDAMDADEAELMGDMGQVLDILSEPEALLPAVNWHVYNTKQMDRMRILLVKHLGSIRRAA